MMEFKVGEADAGTPTDIFVAKQVPTYSPSALKGLFKKKLVQVNNRPEEPGDRLKNGDKVAVDTSALDVKIDKIDLPIIFEDDDVVVINKPAGILTHSKGALNIEPTVASFLAECV